MFMLTTMVSSAQALAYYSLHWHVNWPTDSAIPNSGYADQLWNGTYNGTSYDSSLVVLISWISSEMPGGVESLVDYADYYQHTLAVSGIAMDPLNGGVVTYAPGDAVNYGSEFPSDFGDIRSLITDDFTPDRYAFVWFGMALDDDGTSFGDILWHSDTYTYADLDSYYVVHMTPNDPVLEIYPQLPIVPEPTTAMLALAGIGLLIKRRRCQA